MIAGKLDKMEKGKFVQNMANAQLVQAERRSTLKGEFVEGLAAVLERHGVRQGEITEAPEELKADLVKLRSFRTTGSKKKSLALLDQ